MLTFIVTFTLIGAVAGAACGALAYEPVYRGSKGLSYVDTRERRIQSVIWGGIGALCSLSLALLVLSVAVNTGVSL
jgi:hypothetical protein